jgi:hypothetical protein
LKEEKGVMEGVVGDVVRALVMVIALSVGNYTSENTTHNPHSVAVNWPLESHGLI